MLSLHDMHCHLSFVKNAEELASDARDAGTLLFANTVTPDDWQQACARFTGFENVTVGFGMHPWWVNGETDMRVALEDANPQFVGEVGLDFGKRHQDTRHLQLQIFETVARWAALCGDKTICLHSVHAARETLDVLEKAGALEACTCLFHWFTGPSDQLKRAIQAGCLFSAGSRMLATGKGREYVKAIPASQLLLETDAPPSQGMRYSYAELRAELESAAQSIAEIKGQQAIETIARTSAVVLGENEEW